MKRTKYPEEYQGETERKKRFRPRRFKDLPTDVDGLVSALDAGRLDNRARAARQIKALREAAEHAPAEVTKGLIADLLSVYGVVLAALTQATTRPGARLVDEEGNPHPLVTRHLPTAQRAIIQCGKALQRLETGKGSQNAKAPRTPKSKPENDGLTATDVNAFILKLSEGRKDDED